MSYIIESNPLGIWFWPIPVGLTREAWHLFAIFVGHLRGHFELISAVDGLAAGVSAAVLTLVDPFPAGNYVCAISASWACEFCQYPLHSRLNNLPLCQAIKFRRSKRREKRNGSQGEPCNKFPKAKALLGRARSSIFRVSGVKGIRSQARREKFNVFSVSRSALHRCSPVARVNRSLSPKRSRFQGDLGRQAR